MKFEPAGTLYLTLCSGCSRTYGLPYPRPQRFALGRLTDPEPWFCQRKPCQEAKKRRDQRVADDERARAARLARHRAEQ